MKYNLVEMYVDDEIRTKALQVLNSKRYIKGPENKAFEEEFAKYLSIKYAITTSSGTTALWLIYDALGIGKGDEIIAPSHTFIATVTPAIHLGARPIFADIDEETYTLDPEDVRRKITKRTKAIVVVHLYGHPADIKPLKEIAEEHDIYLIEDCAQAHGAIYHNQKVGTFGDAAAFSFFPSKVMCVAGDGGMAVTNNDEVAEKIRMLRDQGRKDKYEHILLGYNFRMSELHAGIGRIQLKHLEEWIRRRNEIARIYNEVLEGVVRVPCVKPWARHAWYVYTIRTEKRDALREYLKGEGVATGLYYPIPVHMQPAIKTIAPSEPLPITEKVVKEIISLPMHPLLKDADVYEIGKKVVNFFR